MNLSKTQPSVFLVGIDGVALDPLVAFAKDAVDNSGVSDPAIDVERVTARGQQDHTVFYRAEQGSDLIRRELDVVPIRAFHEALLGELIGLRAFAVFLTGSHDKAEALFEATLLRAWSLRVTFLRSMDMRPWLIQAMRETYYWNFRSAARLAVPPADAGARMQGEYLETPVATEMTAVRAAFTRLSPELRWTLLMVGASRLSHEETAQICGVPVSMTSERLDRAQAELTDLLGITRRHRGDTTGA
jgi:RNA polymerase sigma-70 factor, ECF subfamily